MTRLEELLVKERRLRALMETKGLEGVLLKKQPNFSWFTAGGLNMVGIATEMGMTSLLITRTGRYLIANRIESPRMMKEEGLEGLGFQLLEHEWYMDREAELIEKVVGNLNKVGADGGFGSCRNIDNDIKKLRFSLTENEMERYLFLGEKLSRSLEEVMMGIRPGDTECAIAGRIGARLWEDRIDPTGFQIAADERAFRFRHPIPTRQTVKRYVMACVNARYQGLITTITRILHFGKPDPKLLKQFEDNHEIECRMIAATRPGVPASAAFEAGLGAYKELGYETEWHLHNQGGAMGYYARDLRVTRETKDIVEENQAFCWNPSIGGTKTEDGFIATTNGPVMITRPIAYPRVEYRKRGIDILKPGLMVRD